MIEVQNERPKNGEHFSRLLEFCKEVVAICNDLGIAPVLNGQVLTPEAYQQLDEGTRKGIEAHQQKLQGEMAETMRAMRDLEKATKRRLDDFDREIVRIV